LKKKKWVSSLVVASVLFGSANSINVHAASEKGGQVISSASLTNLEKEATITQEKALELAKKAVKIPSGYQQQEIRFDYNYYTGQQLWMISWNKQSRPYGSINVSVDAETGEIISIDMYNNDNAPATPLKISYEKAVESAKKYIESLYPGKLKEMQIDSNMKEYNKTYQNGTYMVRFYQLVNGIPFYENNISVQVDGNEKIRGFNYLWNNSFKFANTEGIMTEEKARQLFTSNIGLELYYQYASYSNSFSKQAQLVYAPKQVANNSYINIVPPLYDAKTGDLLGVDGKAANQEPGITLPTGPVLDKPVEQPTPTKELTKNEALKAVTDKLSIPEHYVVENVNYQDDYGSNGRKVWVFNWRNGDGSGPSEYIMAMVDAKTGELVRYYNDNNRYYSNQENSSDFEVKVDMKQALQIAIDFVKGSAATKGDRLYATMPQEIKDGKWKKARTYTIYFSRKENGLTVLGQGVSVNISAETGAITSYSLDWNNLTFPSKDQVISAEKAKEIYVKNTPTTFYHFLIPNGDQRGTETTLVYGKNSNFEIPKYLDAIDGKWRNFETGKEIGSDTVATDIKGHKAEKQLQSMIDLNIFDVVNGKVQPDKVVTKAEAITFIMRALGERSVWINPSLNPPFTDVKMEDEFYPYLQRAIERDIIKVDSKTFKPIKSITREEIAVLLVRSLGYEKLASYPGLFSVKYKDQTKIKEKGSVGLISGLGIFSSADKNGNFLPAKTMTRADLAIVLSKFLEIQPEIRSETY
jgi:hypothetical protein